MKIYRHILLAVDFSEQDDLVALKAKGLAEKYRAELSIVHVLDNIPMPDTGYGTVIPLYEYSDYDQLEAEKKRLKEISDGLDIANEKRWMIWGTPKDEIIRLSKQEHIDLIVIGSHGRHGFSLLLGSTANSVLHNADCDVMAIRLPNN